MVFEKVEKDFERLVTRRRFLAGLGTTAISVALAKLALTQTRAEELARQNSPGVATGTGRRTDIAYEDVPNPKIVRTGSETGTILANGLAVTINKTLSPAFTSAEI